MIRQAHSPLLSAMHCRPHSGYAAIAALFAREWGNLFSGNLFGGNLFDGYPFGGYVFGGNQSSGSQFGSGKSAHRNGVFTEILVVIQILLIADRFNRSGRCRYQPAQT